MPSKREQLKAQLMAEVEAMIEAALARGENDLTLEAIEDIALVTREQVGQALTGSLIAQQAERGEAALPSCPACGQTLHPKGKKGRYLRTRSGEARIERAYFYCAACKRGLFPPG
jgi:ribosomal protein L34E